MFSKLSMKQAMDILGDAIEGKPMCEEFSDDSVTRYYVVGRLMVVSFYNRRTTVTTYGLGVAPKSLM